MFDMKVKKDVDMKYVSKKRLCSYLILVGLLCNVNAAKQAENVKFLKEICVIACLPGKGPGQYIYAFGKPDFFLPICFAIDPNDGAFYIPEVDLRDNIRLHKFDRNGNFITMLRPEGKAHSVYDIAVSSNSDIYLYIERVLGQCISRHNHEGKLLNTFGPQGPITKKDMDAERKAMLRGEETNREKYFFGRCRIFILPDDKVFVVKIRDYEKRILDTYKFDGRSDRLL